MICRPGLRTPPFRGIPPCAPDNAQGNAEGMEEDCCKITVKCPMPNPAPANPALPSERQLSKPAVLCRRLSAMFQSIPSILLFIAFGRPASACLPVSAPTYPKAVMYSEGECSCQVMLSCCAVLGSVHPMSISYHNSIKIAKPEKMPFRLRVHDTQRFLRISLLFSLFHEWS